MNGSSPDRVSLRLPNDGATRPTYARPMKAFLAGLALATMLLASVASAAGNAQRTRVIHTKAIIESFALGGDRLAYDLRGFTSCNRVLVLNLRTNRTSRVSGKQTCTADITSTGLGVRELAVAGTRLAWIINQGGNTESDDHLYTVSLPRPKERRLASAMRFGEPGGRQAGKWIGNLVASGNLLAVNRWTTNEDGATTSSGVDLIVGNRLRRIVSSRKAILGQAADTGRIAVLYAGGTVELYSTNGARRQPPRADEGANVGALQRADRCARADVAVAGTGPGRARPLRRDRDLRRPPAEHAAELQGACAEPEDGQGGGRREWELAAAAERGA